MTVTEPRCPSRRLDRQTFERNRLTDDERRRFETEGILVLPGALSAVDVERLAAISTRHARQARADRGLSPTSRYDTSRMLTIDPAFLELTDHPLVLPKVVDLLGPNIYLYHTQFNALPPTEPDSQPNYFSWHWHQDNEQLIADLRAPRSPQFNIKAVFFFSDVTRPDAGNTYYVPGSQHLDARPPSRADAEHILEGARPMLAPAGSVVLMDTRMWHCGTPNRGRHERLAAWFGYGFRWLRRYGMTGDLEELRSACDPVRAQLLDLEGTETFLEGYVSDRYSSIAIRELPLARLAGYDADGGHTPSLKARAAGRIGPPAASTAGARAGLEVEP